MFNAITFTPTGILYGEASNGNLYRINTTTGTPTLVSLTQNFDAPQTLVARDNASLLGFHSNGVVFYAVPTDGSAASVQGFSNAPSNPGLGGLSFGPNNILYGDFYNGSKQASYQVSATSGFVTPVGSVLGPASGFSLGYDGTTLYGIDTVAGVPNRNDIYSINTVTGVAVSSGVSVTGMPSNDTVLAYAYSPTALTPEPNAVLLCAGFLTAGGILRARRKRHTSMQSTCYRGRTFRSSASGALYR